MLKILLPAAMAAALIALPLSIKAQEYSDPPSKSGQPSGKTTKSTTKAKTSTETTSSETTTKKKREPTKGQLEARERQKKCGAEWREAKAKGTLEKGITWPKYWSACNKRLKQQPA
jgi:hypothetical protein